MSDKRHPPSSYDAKYPMNRVRVTESGHELHFDDTPGAERIREAHKSGSYREVSANGRIVEMTVASHHTYVKHGYTVTVDMNHDHKVGGSARSSVSGDSHSETKGNSTSSVDGDHKQIVGGDHVSAVRGDSVHGVTGQTIMKIGKGIQVKGDSDIKSKIDGGAELQFGKDLVISSETKIVLKVGGSTVTITPSDIVFEAAGDIVHSTPSGMQWFGQESAGEKTGDKIVTLSGPMKKGKGKPE